MLLSKLIFVALVVILDFTCALLRKGMMEITLVEALFVLEQLLLTYDVGVAGVDAVLIK